MQGKSIVSHFFKQKFTLTLVFGNLCQKKKRDCLIKNSGKSKRKQRKSSKNYYLCEFLMRIDRPMGRGDLEQKLSADEREAYKCTLSEETAIE
jgi:hypothetical protein